MLRPGESVGASVRGANLKLARELKTGKEGGDSELTSSADCLGPFDAISAYDTIA